MAIDAWSANPEAIAFAMIGDIEDYTVKLSLVVDWRDELVRKLRRAALRFELCGLDAEEQEQLTQEVLAFTSLCRTLADTLRRGE